MAIHRVQKTLKYGQGSHVHSIPKTDIHKPLIGTIKLSDINCKIDNPNYVQCIEIKDSGNAFCVSIDWNKCQMRSSEERFSLTISYKNNISYIIEVAIDWVKQTPKLSCTLSPQQTVWGDGSACCILQLEVGEVNSPSWMYTDINVALQISVSPDFYLDQDAPSSIQVCNSITIPIYYRYKGAISKTEQKELIVVVNGHSLVKKITFNPIKVRPEDITVKLLFHNNIIELGSGVINCGSISLVNNNEYAYLPATISLDVNSPIKGLFKTSKSLNNQWELSIDSNVIKRIPKQSIGAELLINDEVGSYSVGRFLIAENLKPGERGVIIKAKNSILIKAKCAIGSTLYSTESRLIDLPFDVTNTSTRQLDKITLKLEGKYGNTILFDNHKTEKSIINLAAGESRTIKVRIDNLDKLISIGSISGQIIPDNDYQDNEKQKLDFSYIVSEMLPPNIQVSPSTCDNLYFDEEYREREVCSFQLTNAPIPELPYNAIADLDFSKLVIDDQRFKLKQVSGKSKLKVNESDEIQILLSGSIAENECENNNFTLSLSYDEGIIPLLIPFIQKVYSGPVATSSTLHDGIINGGKKGYGAYFPAPDSDRIIPFFKFEFGEERKEVLHNPRLIVGSPFCINNTPTLHELSLSDYPGFDICLNCSELGIAENNIESEIGLECSLSYKDDFAPEPYIGTIKVFILPYDLSAKGNIYILGSQGDKLENGTLNVQLAYNEDSDVRSLHIGRLVVENLTKYPWRDEKVVVDGVINIGVLKKNEQGEDVYCGHENLSATKEPCHIEVYNGEPAWEKEIYLNIEQWIQVGKPREIGISLFELTSDKKFKPRFLKRVILDSFIDDDIFSLDLGTTGIVMAKEHDGTISLLELLDEQDYKIEEDPHILSSIVVLKDGDKDNFDSFELAPDRIKYLSNSQYHVVVPSKFIIGQKRIPFSPKIKGEKINAFGQEISLSNGLNVNFCNGLVGALYKHIFEKRLSEKDKTKIKKLVVTYPNTYSQENVEEVRKILKSELQIDERDVLFIPESDAVAAYYFAYRINQEDARFSEKERVVIYDMGAGTLDVSVVEFAQDGTSMTATIEQKIGIPIAGNYLDYVLYKELERLGILTDKVREEKEGENLVKEFISVFKTFFLAKDNEENILAPEWINRCSDYQDFIDFEKVIKVIKNIDTSSFVTVCTKTLFDILNLSDQKVDRVVLSGRGSQFVPLQNEIQAYFGKDCVIEKIPDYMNGNLKTCVAIGALKYVQYFDHSANASNKIYNKNQYQRIGVVYRKRVPGGLKTAYETLLDPDTVDWKTATEINGSRCHDFNCSVDLSDVEGSEKIYYIQTLLKENDIIRLYTNTFLQGKDNKEDALLRGFINELFSTPRNRLLNNHNVRIELNVNINNTITKRRIGELDLTDKTIIEDIENNAIYKRSMWPFIK